ncbi:MAG TPA: tetratricopeptide repeat protein [Casimicrobiaceae bacterium]|nr:tetratricopeptide repeat protein [Casimicrobiaceae bacterium]
MSIGPALAGVEAALARGDTRSALAQADAALARSDLPTDQRAAILALRSRAHEAAGQLAAAATDLEGAIALAPQDARLQRELGIVYADLGDTMRSIDAFRHATQIDPRHPRGFNNLGNALRAAGRLDEAAQAFERGVALDPGYALCWANLAIVQRERGEPAAAATALERALALDPRERGTLITLAGLCRQQGDIDAAARLYEQALQREQRDASTWLQLGLTVAQRDDLASARSAFDQAQARDPAMLRATLARDLILPMVYQSHDDLEQSRDRYVEGIAALERELPQRYASLDASRLLDELRWSNFLLAYQGRDDRELQARYAGLIAAAVQARAPQWLDARPRRARAGRLRVGFVSAFFRDGTAGRYFARWITGLPRDRFEVLLFRLNPTVDDLTALLESRADAEHDASRWRPMQLAQTIGDAQLDVIVYPELGMDSTAFLLAALRLAPVQCAGWGHPVTSGHANIDVFFSSEAMERPGAQRDYVERLVMLPGIGTNYARPVVPPAAERSSLGLPDAGPLLLCPQSLFKIHPDNDALFAAVLEAVPEATLVLFEGRHPALTAKYLARLDRAFGRVGVSREQRVRVLPQRAHEDYLRINLACDAMLDTLHWSGGNTSLDALACGLPIVTLPGDLMRSRQSYGMLQLMGITDTIADGADSYTCIATRIVRDREWRASLRERIMAAQGRVFDDPAPVDAFARVLEQLA